MWCSRETPVFPPVRKSDSDSWENFNSSVSDMTAKTFSNFSKNPIEIYN